MGSSGQPPLAFGGLTWSALRNCALLLSVQARICHAAMRRAPSNGEGIVQTMDECSSGRYER
jgi:hypothetical protein